MFCPFCAFSLCDSVVSLQFSFGFCDSVLEFCDFVLGFSILFWDFVILFWVLCSCFFRIGHSIEHITKGVQTKIFAFSRYNLVSVTTDIKDSGLLVG